MKIRSGTHRHTHISHWVIAGLLVLIVTTGTAMAATGTAVNIADPANAANVAKVDSTGHLSVGDGSGALTVDGTVNTRPGPPTSSFRSLGTTNGSQCVTVAAPPSGKGLVITALNIDTWANPSPGSGSYYYLGVAASTACGSGPIALLNNPPGIGLDVPNVGLGISVPAGQVLWVFTNNLSVEVYAYGYSLPSSAVPGTATPAGGSAPRGTPGARS